MHSKWDDRYQKPAQNPDGSYPYEVAAFQFRYGLLTSKTAVADGTSNAVNVPISTCWLYSNNEQISVKAPIISSANSDRWGDNRKLLPPDGFLAVRDSSTEVQDFDNANPHKFRDHAVQYTSRNLMGNVESEWMTSPKPGLVFSIKIESLLPIKDGFSFDDSTNDSMSDFSIYEETGRYFKFRARKMINGMDFTQSPEIVKQIDTYSFDHKSTEELIAYDWFYSHSQFRRPFILGNPKIIDISDDGKRCLVGFVIPPSVQHMYSFVNPGQITENISGFIPSFRFQNQFGFYALPNRPPSFPVAFVEFEMSWDEEEQDLNFVITRAWSRKNVGYSRRQSNDLGTSSRLIDYEFYKIEDYDEDNDSVRCVNRTIWMSYEDGTYNLRAYRYRFERTGSDVITNDTISFYTYLFEDQGEGVFDLSPEELCYQSVYTIEYDSEGNVINRELSINSVDYDAEFVVGDEDGRAFEDYYLQAPNIIIPHARIFALGLTKARNYSFTLIFNEEDYYYRELQLDGVKALNSNGLEITHTYVPKLNEPALGQELVNGLLSNPNHTYCTRDPDTGDYILFADRPVVFT